MLKVHKSKRAEMRSPATLSGRFLPLVNDNDYKQQVQLKRSVEARERHRRNMQREIRTYVDVEYICLAQPCVLC